LIINYGFLDLGLEGMAGRLGLFYLDFTYMLVALIGGDLMQLIHKSMDPGKVFDLMDKEKTGSLCLDDLQGCIEGVPAEFSAYVKQMLVNYIFTQKSFEISKANFIRLFSKEVSRGPMFVHIDLGVLLGNESAKKQPKLFSLRLMKRLKEKQSSSISLRKILDESEEFCEK
jgi:hypothetical protein